MVNTILAVVDIHISLKAETLFKWGPLNVTNSMIFGLVGALLLITVMVPAAYHIKLRPKKGFSALIEMLVEHITGMLTGVFGSREAAVQFVPYFGFYFIFILFNYLLSLLPIVGVGLYSSVAGEHLPLFRAVTADLNTTIAMSVIAIIMVQALSLREQGLKRHFQHYFSDKPLNPINFFIGVLEVFAELTRIMSLSLRLFLNTAVGDILIVVFSSMILANGRTPVAALPIILFEALVAYIQAYVFAILAATYLSVAIAHDTSHEDHSPVDTSLEPGGNVSGTN